MTPEDRIRFDNPPVTETILGVEFESLKGWGVQYLGLLWARIRDRYPKFEEHPGLISQLGLQQFVSFAPPPMRGWYIDETGTRVIQVQHDRLNYNWRKQDESEYPLYEQIQPEFRDGWTSFLEFLREQSIPVPKITQAAVTYINHITRGEGWNTLMDLSHVLRSLKMEEAPEGLTDPEFVVIGIGYKLKSGNHVRFDVQPGQRVFDQKEVIQISVTVSGMPQSSETDDILAWLDSAQQELVRSFVDFTTDEIQRTVWKRKK